MAETKRWRVAASTIGTRASERVVEVDAANWIVALRTAQRSWGESSGVPAGASCGVAPDGTVTIIDSNARSKTVLTDLSYTESSASSQDAPSAANDHTSEIPAFGRTGARVGRESRSATIAAFRSTAPSAQPPAGPFSSKSGLAMQHLTTPKRAPSPAQKPPQPIGTYNCGEGWPKLLRLVTQRNDDPTPDSPLSYRERAFAISPGTTLVEAESALRNYLSSLQRDLRTSPRGKFINLAVFDHTWSDIPRRPPLVVLEWMDWRQDVGVSYPAAELAARNKDKESEEAERLAALFEAFKDLPHVRSAAAALDLALELLALAVPCAASAACLYDINANKLRFVAARGHGAQERRGTAVALHRGMLGRAAREQEEATTHTITGHETTYDVGTDSRPGLRTQTLLLRPLAHNGQLLGILQLINRKGGEELFTRGDLNLANYVGDRLSQTLSDLRTSRPPGGTAS